MCCDNKAITFNINNLTLHECTKFIEVDCHDIKDEKYLKKSLYLYI